MNPIHFDRTNQGKFKSQKPEMTLEEKCTLYVDEMTKLIDGCVAVASKMDNGGDPSPLGKLTQWDMNAKKSAYETALKQFDAIFG